MTEPHGEHRPGDRLRRVALAVLAVPGIGGAVLSWESMRTAAATVFDPRLAVAFPALVDALALGAALRWVASVRDGTPISGWRVTAHTAVGASILLNALAADTLGQVPWHITAPAVWSALVELFARDMARAWRHATRHDPTARDRIPVRLWLLAPRESATTWIRQARTGQPSAIAARVDADRIAAAATALRVTLPGRRHRRTRREITRRLTAGTLSPAALPDVLGWSVTSSVAAGSVIQAATRSVLGAAATDPIQSPVTSPGPGHPLPGPSAVPEPQPSHERRPVPNGLPEPARLNGHHRVRTATPAAETGTTRRPVTDSVPAARADDVAALRAAVAAGDLPQRPTVAAIRDHLQIGTAYARAARHAFLNSQQADPEDPDQR